MASVPDEPDPLADPDDDLAAPGVLLDDDDSGPSRRQVLAGASGAGLLAASRPAPLTLPRTRPGPAISADGTPEQIHLSWGRDPATSVSVSWAAPDPAVRPRVLLGWAGGSRVSSAV